MVTFSLVPTEVGYPLLQWMAIDGDRMTIDFPSPAEAEACLRFHYPDTEGEPVPDPQHSRPATRTVTFTVARTYEAEIRVDTAPGAMNDALLEAVELDTAQPIDRPYVLHITDRDV